MRVGENLRKFYRNMEFNRSSRQLAVIGLGFFGLCGPAVMIAFANFALVNVASREELASVTMAVTLSTVNPRLRFGSRHWKGTPRLALARMGFDHLVRHRNPNLDGVVESITYSLYDQVSFAQSAAFTRTIRFQSPLGQAGKTKAQTNLSIAGSLPTPHRFTIYGICAHISNNTIPADMQNLLQNVSFELAINTKSYQVGPLAMFPAGRGWKVDAVAGVGVLPAGSSTVLSTLNGPLDSKGVFMLDIPITIEQGEHSSRPESGNGFQLDREFNEPARRRHGDHGLPRRQSGTRR